MKAGNYNEEDATIVRAVLGIGRGLGLPVLAEGVETQAELRFLQDERCDEVQGYLLGRPADIGSYRNLTDAGAAPDVDEALGAAPAKTAPAPQQSMLAPPMKAR